ncbi:MAG: response regulator [Comamonadaceae bacterium]|nr:response regulator [Comamonadaceae bacterium]
MRTDDPTPQVKNTPVAAAVIVPTLLFVDDEPSILSSLQRLFRPRGYKILTAESGEAGLAMLDAHPVDVVVSDMRMPIMDGAQFLEKVRQKTPETMRLLLTGYADINATINAINKGEIYRLISKPWDDNDILLIVKKALEHKALRAENQRLLVLTQQQSGELKGLNSGLEKRVQERTAEIEQVNSFLNLANGKLKQNFLVSIKVFSGLIELREGAVAGHARRVADMARRMASRMALPTQVQQDVFVAALLHDIGKIGFSDALLSKPVSKLVNEDLARYRKHALSGEAALMPLVELQGVAKIVRSHHERFDGEGFPDGLSGAAIPLGAQILAIANDYDGFQIGTLTERRYSADEAKTLLLQGSGKRYDPKVIDVILDVIGKPREELGRYRELPAAELVPGMVSGKDILSRDGTLLLAADYVLDAIIVRQIQTYAIREGIHLMVSIRTDKRFNTASPTESPP